MRYKQVVNNGPEEGPWAERKVDFFLFELTYCEIAQFSAVSLVFLLLGYYIWSVIESLLTPER